MSWENKNGKLFREFKFKNFLEALNFVNKVGELAEEINHHPDIVLKWGHVGIELWTHDTKSITAKDHKLANKIDTLI